MSDKLAIFPHGTTSTAVWDVEENRSAGVLEGSVFPIEYAVINDCGTVAATFEQIVATVAAADIEPDDVEVGLPLAVKIWSLDTMQSKADLTSTCTSAKLLKKHLIIAPWEGPVKVWDIGGSAPVALMDLPHTGVRAIDATDESNMVLCSGDPYRICLWDLRSGQCARVLSEEPNNAYIARPMTISMDSASRKAVSGSWDRKINLWDLGSGRCIKTYQHGGVVRDVMMHETGGSFLSVGYSATFKAWNTSSGSDQPLLEANISSLLGTPDIDDTFVRAAASRDLSRVALCHPKDIDGLKEIGVSIWGP